MCVKGCDFEYPKCDHKFGDIFKSGKIFPSINVT